MNAAFLALEREHFVPEMGVIPGDSALAPLVVSTRGVSGVGQSLMGSMLAKWGPPLTRIRHRECGGVAFRILGWARPGDLMDAGEVRYDDGRTVLSHSMVTCGACGEGVAPTTLKVERE